MNESKTYLVRHSISSAIKSAEMALSVGTPSFRDEVADNYVEFLLALKAGIRELRHAQSLIMQAQGGKEE